MGRRIRNGNVRVACGRDWAFHPLVVKMSGILRAIAQYWQKFAIFMLWRCGKDWKPRHKTLI
ncbi:hypothetical protein TMES_06525 [Thalassospira mesophila]|uniref:Uncharacterized protein n=1 Tax=Thalassospira mesophila TaxID=1293891 RepID=A0A1Y2L2C8_9PROT|nr:hypothetical protein TMES_06525 [Thalassospira mesophila]